MERTLGTVAVFGVDQDQRGLAAVQLAWLMAAPAVVVVSELYQFYKVKKFMVF